MKDRINETNNNRVIVAGASGYLGQHIIRELKLRKWEFKALVRNPSKLNHLNLKPDQVIVAEVTKPDTLRDIFEEGDIVISSVGITRQKDRLNYKDVDFQANMNLLSEAKAAGVSKFVYISILNGEAMRYLKIIEAKEAFVDSLKISTLDFSIIRPNGFFSDMKDFLQMAKTGRVYLFGNGEFKLNPIDGGDLAKVVIDSINQRKTEIEVGGPDILTQNEIAQLALKAYDRKPRVIHLPDWIRTGILGFLRTLTSSKTYGPYEFFLTMMAQDNVAPRYGVIRLKDFFKEEADRIH